MKTSHSLVPRVRKLRWGMAVAALLLAACGPIAAPAPPARQPGPVLLYGDSLVWEAQPYLTPGADTFARNGAAPCDFLKHMAHAGTPNLVVVAFSGNMTACSGSVPRYTAYLNDFAAIKAMFPHSRVVFVIPPARLNPPGNDDVALAVRNSGAEVFDARTPLSSYPRDWDGAHLTDDGDREYARLLSSLWSA